MTTSNLIQQPVAVATVDQASPQSITASVPAVTGPDALTAATSEAAPVDTDEVISLRAGTKRTTWTVIKAFFKTYFDGLYVLAGGKANGQTINGGTGPGESITITGTSSSTKSTSGINLGALHVDEVNGRVGVKATPVVTLQANGHLLVRADGALPPVLSGAYEGLYGIRQEGGKSSYLSAAYGVVNGISQTRNNADGSYINALTVARNMFGTINTTTGAPSIGATMDAVAAEQFSSTTLGMNFRFLTTTKGTTTLVERLRITENGNITIGALADPANSLTKGLVIGNGTAPSASLADATQIWSADIGAVGGKAGLHIRSEDGSIVSIGNAVSAPTFKGSAIPIYANNAAAIADGLTAGAFYRSGGDPDLLAIVH